MFDSHLKLILFYGDRALLKFQHFVLLIYLLMFPLFARADAVSRGGLVGFIAVILGVFFIIGIGIFYLFRFLLEKMRFSNGRKNISSAIITVISTLVLFFATLGFYGGCLNVGSVCIP